MAAVEVRRKGREAGALVSVTFMITPADRERLDRLHARIREQDQAASFASVMRRVLRAGLDNLSAAGGATGFIFLNGDRR